MYEDTTDVTLETVCQLISSTGAHDPIDLLNGKTETIGRGPKTLILDKKCSRNQLHLTANYNNREVTVLCQGLNPSRVGGRLLQKGETTTLGPNGVLEVLEGEYKYYVHFGQQLSEASRQHLKAVAKAADMGQGDEGGCLLDEECAVARNDNSLNTSASSPVRRKRKASDLHPASPEHGPGSAKQAKLDPSAASDPAEGFTPASLESSEEQVKPQQKSLHCFFKANPEGHVGSSFVPSSALTQTWREQSSTIVFQYGPATPSSSIASFDLDGTLIQTASGKRFARDTADWKFAAKVPEKLRQLQGDGYKIVVFTNQLGIPKGKPSMREFKEKVQAIATRLAVPLLLLASTSEDVYRKPCVGLWEHMVRNENAGVAVDMASSFYVGDAAGRLADWRPGAKKDFSCSDRKFAANLDLTFHTPEEYFESTEKTTKFTWGDFDPRTLDCSISGPILEPKDAKLCSDGQEVVIFQGCPASGKTTFYTVHMKARGYVHVNRDTLGTWQKCVAECERALKAGRSVVIDNTNPTVEARSRYTEVCRRLGVAVRCFSFTTSIGHAKHNNRFRELTTTDSNYKRVNNIAFNTYKSQYCEPSTSEGFAEVVKINFTPCSFTSDKKHDLYHQFLV